jgi:hypothetical protein
MSQPKDRKLTISTLSLIKKVCFPSLLSVDREQTEVGRRNIQISNNLFCHARYFDFADFSSCSYQLEAQLLIYL